MQSKTIPVVSSESRELSTPTITAEIIQEGQQENFGEKGIHKQVSQIAGRLKYFAIEWETITSDRVRISYVKGYKIPFELTSRQGYTRQCNPSDREKIQFISSRSELIKKGIIVICEYEEAQFLFSIFLVPKPDDSFRFILNLKNLNEFITAEHFKMEE